MFFLIFFLFISSVFPHYHLKNYTNSNGIYKGFLAWNGTIVYGSSSFKLLQFELRLSKVPRFTVKPVGEKRWEIPSSYYDYEPAIYDDEEYGIVIKNETGFSISVTRIFDSFKIFDFSVSTFQDQFIDFDISLGNVKKMDDYIYGLGERTSPFRLQKEQDYTIFNKNYHVTYPGLNLYGSHPVFFQVHPSNGNVNGLYFHNSNAMDINLGTHEMRYRAIGGIIDLFILPGYDKEDILVQYFSIIGQPRMIPTWALGFHNCKYGYNSTDTLESVVGEYRKKDIPLEAIWSDIDYMDGYKTFTVDPKMFDGLGKFVKKLHDDYDQRYILIIDPGIKIEKGYKPYDDGIKSDIFIKDAENKLPMTGSMFCGETNFPDFQNKKTYSYWKSQIEDLYKLVEFDGAWLDQDELTSFCDGFCHDFKEKIGNKYDSPPYVPGLTEKNKHYLYNLTISLSSNQNLSVHYNTHNLYPLEESMTTIEAIEDVRKKRSFVVSRSSFTGQGKFSGHWLGDNNATFEDLKQSISGILSFNMFGIPFVGADIGGFYNRPSKELMIRWIELGSFYPFMRDHAHRTVKHQELYSFDEEVTSVSIEMIHRRYTLIHYFYTTFYKFHKYSYPPVASPLWMVLPFPDHQADVDKFLSNDVQFMIGDCLLISPVLDPIPKDKKESVLEIYLDPSSRWYRFQGQENHKKGWINVNVPLDEINMNIKGGCALPLVTPEYSVKDSFEGEVTFVCGFDDQEGCKGDIYLDDGESLKYEDIMKYGTFIGYSTEKNGRRESIYEEDGNPEDLCKGKVTMFEMIINDDSNGKNGISRKLKDIKIYGVKDQVYDVHVVFGTELQKNRKPKLQRVNDVIWVTGVNVDIFGDDWKIVICREKQEDDEKNIALILSISIVSCLLVTCCVVCVSAWIGMFICGGYLAFKSFVKVGRSYEFLNDEVDESVRLNQGSGSLQNTESTNIENNNNPEETKEDSEMEGMEEVAIDDNENKKYNSIED